MIALTPLSARAAGFKLVLTNYSADNPVPPDLLAQFPLRMNQKNALGESFTGVGGFSEIDGAAIDPIYFSAENKSIEFTCALPNYVRYTVSEAIGLDDSGRFLVVVNRINVDGAFFAILSPTGKEVTSFCPQVAFKMDKACSTYFYWPSWRGYIEPSEAFFDFDVNSMKNNNSTDSQYPSQCKLSAVIKDPSGKPLKNLTVLLESSIKKMAILKTDSNGRAAVTFNLFDYFHALTGDDYFIFHAPYTNKTWRGKNWYVYMGPQD